FPARADQPLSCILQGRTISAAGTALSVCGLRGLAERAESASHEGKSRILVPATGRDRAGAAVAHGQAAPYCGHFPRGDAAFFSVLLTQRRPPFLEPGSRRNALHDAAGGLRYTALPLLGTGRNP